MQARRVIYKYEVQVEDRFSLRMDANAKILALQLQRGVPQVWVLVDPEGPVQERTFRVIGTGQPFDVAGLEYVATFQPNSLLVFHLFEEKSSARG